MTFLQYLRQSEEESVPIKVLEIKIKKKKFLKLIMHSQLKFFVHSIECLLISSLTIKLIRSSNEVLGNHPRTSFAFELSPFKLTNSAGLKKRGLTLTYFSQFLISAYSNATDNNSLILQFSQLPRHSVRYFFL